MKEFILNSFNFFAKENGPNGKRKDLFTKRNGPDMKNVYLLKSWKNLS